MKKGLSNTLIGLTVSIVLAGAVYGAYLVEQLVEQYDKRQTETVEVSGHIGRIDEVFEKKGLGINKYLRVYVGEESYKFDYSLADKLKLGQYVTADIYKVSGEMKTLSVRK